MGRTPYCDDKTGFRKGTWTAEEDRKLTVTRYGCWNWRQLPKHAGLARCGKSCRLRWVNYLKPDIKRGNFTKQEDQIILDLHQHLGNKWSSIAAKLPGRTDNEIKNHWHTSLKKQSKQPPPPSRRRRKPNKGSSSSDGGENSPQNKDHHSPPPPSGDDISESIDQRPSSSVEASSSSSSSGSASLTERDVTVADGGSFWTEPFIVEGNNGNGWSSPSTSGNEFDVGDVPSSSSMELGLLFPPFPFLPDCDDDFDHLLLFDSLWL